MRSLPDTQDEILDIVDKNDQVVGTLERSKVYAAGLNNFRAINCFIVNDEGDIHIKGSVDTGDLPIEGDTNPGAKIWLVLSGDVDCEAQTMIGWNGTEYLFEYDLISFDATD